MRRKSKGIAIGAFGAASYGTNPLFALPLFAGGLSVNSVLFYRYFIAVILFGLWIKFYKKKELGINFKEALFMFPLAIIFALSSLTLFSSYNYIDAGIASTILFIYPLLVALIMALFFKERLTIKTISAIGLTMAGIALLYKGKNGEALNLKGLLLVFSSAMLYAVYMVAIKKVKILQHANSSKLTFYVMLFGLTVFGINLKGGLLLEPLTTPFQVLCALALAILPTIVSLETMTIAIKLIGPTLSAILGALEPVTAVFFGVMLFGEQLTIRIITGICLILAAVMMIVIKPKENKPTTAKKQI